MQKLKKAKDEGLVIVVGRAGAGKTTTINYLLDCPMNEMHVNGIKSAVPASSHKVRIDPDSNLNSFPVFVVDPKNDLTFCDCVGFGDAGTEFQFCSLINTRMAIKNAKSIKSIIVVIEWKDILSGEDVSILEDIDKLLSIIGIENYKSYPLLFVITKGRYVTGMYNNKTDLMKRIDQLCGNESAKKNKWQPQAINIKRKIMLLELLKARNENVFLIDVFDRDKGKSKNEILKFINNCKSVPLKDFNFDGAGDENDDYIDDLITYIANENREFLRKRINTCKEMIEYELKIEYLQNQEQYLRKREKFAYQQWITAYKDAHDRIDEKIKKLEEEKETKSKNFEELIDGTALFWENEYSTAKFVKEYWSSFAKEVSKGENHFSKRLCTKGIKYYFNYSDVPYESVQVTPLNGSLTNVRENKAKGTYYAEFEPIPSLVKTAKCTVQIFVEKKKIPANIIILADIANDLVEIQANRETL